MYFIIILSIVLLFYTTWYIFLKKTQVHHLPQKIKHKFSVHYVVARYNENLDWALKFPNLYIYNKGAIIPEIPTIELENVGREGHTYYHHIVQHYDQLPDAIVFLQGYPFDHSPNLFKTLSCLKKQSFYNLSEKTLQSDMYNGLSWHYNIYSWWNKLPTIPKKLPMKVFRTLFNKNPKQWISYGTGAQFMVSKESILKRPKEFYQKIIDMLSKSNSPIEGYVMERLHEFVFTDA